MTDDQIAEIAQQLYGAALTDEQLRNHKTIEFARLIAEKQKEIDTGICEKLVYANGVASQCARAIRKGGMK